MKRSRIAVIVIAFILALGWLALGAETRPPEDQRQIEQEGERPRGRDRRQMTPERIEQMLERIKGVDAEAAEHLLKLQQEDPNSFLKELREYMRSHRSELFSGEWGREGRPPMGPQEAGPMDGPGKGKGQSRWGRGGGPGGGRGERMQRMQRKHEKYLDWLKENYPQEAQELEKVRQENPELYMRRLMHSGRKYGRIAEAAKDNPELAAVLKEDLELKDERDEIVQKLRSAEGEETEALTAELKEIVSKRFDLIVKRKQLQHKQLLEKLEKLKKQVEESEAEAEKWEATKDEKVESRLKELIERSEKFRWD
jgi:hypothetical protein